MQTLTIRLVDSPASDVGDVYHSPGKTPEFLAFGSGPAGDDRSAQYTTVLDLNNDEQNPEPTRWRVIVGLDLEPGHEAEFEEWYNTEHLPALARVPGVRRAVRFLRETPAGTPGGDLPTYVALYDLEEREIHGNPDWKAAIDTPWSDKMRPYFIRHWGGLYERLD